MSTPAAPVTSTISKVEKTLGVWLDTKHLILLALLAGALLSGIYLFESKRADLAEAKAQVASQAAAQAQKGAQAAIQANLATQAQDKTKKVQSDFDAYKKKQHKNFFKVVGISLGIGIGIGAHYL